MQGHYPYGISAISALVEWASRKTVSNLYCLSREIAKRAKIIGNENFIRIADHQASLQVAGFSSPRSVKNLPYDLMRKLTDVPDELLLAYCEVYTADTAEHLLAQVRRARTLSDLPAIRQHLLESLLAFGIADAVAREYLEGR